MNPISSNTIPSYSKGGVTQVKKEGGNYLIFQRL